MKAAILILLALWMPPSTIFAAGRAKVVLPPLRPLTVECVFDAARASGMPAAALFAILATEGGKTGEALSNRNGTWDLGPFQINTVHLDALAAMGIAPDDILRDGRVNAYAAAWLLRKDASMRMRRPGCCGRNINAPGISGRPSARTIPARRIAGMPISGAYKPT